MLIHHHKDSVLQGSIVKIDIIRKIIVFLLFTFILSSIISFPAECLAITFTILYKLSIVTLWWVFRMFVCIYTDIYRLSFYLLHLFTYLFIDWLIDLFIYWCIYLLIHLLIYLLMYLFTNLFIYSSIYFIIYSRIYT